MKNVSDKFKKEITKYGRTIDAVITYELDGQQVLLDSDILQSINPHFNGNILKSVMKELDIEASIAIPKGTEINVRMGILINHALTVSEVRNMKVRDLLRMPVKYLTDELKDFEYINIGNYIVKDEPEYNADTLSYTHKCYDKLLYSMKEYEEMNITFPITVREYIRNICEYLGLTFANINDSFANYDKEIMEDYYIGYDYTFRDVLDELAQVTASTICINENDELEIRYINNESVVEIDEDFFKDTNVTFEDTYGPVNSIVLSRSGESDNVYLRDEESVQNNGLCEIKIIENQIMNYNDRSDYLPDILSRLDGLTYSTNDFDSYGICFLELCDRYTANVHGNRYNCVLLNDDIKITQGLEENIYTEMPEISETDYTKSDKTDQRINKAYIIMDKVNQKLESVISQQTETTEKITKHEQDINSISDKVSSIADLTRTEEGIKQVTIENCVEGDLLELHIYGNNTVFEYLYPSNDLYPSDTLYPYGDSRISVTNFPEGSEEGTERIYELGIKEVLRQNGNICDEYILKDGKASVIRRIDKAGNIKAQETIEELGEYAIQLLAGKNIIKIKNYSARLSVKYAVKSDYTDIFATKVEMGTSIAATAEEINLEVKKKVDENEVISKINMSSESVGINANKIELTANDVLNLLAGNTINLSGKRIKIASDNFNVDEEGNMTCRNANINGTITSDNATITGGSFNVKTSSNATDTVRVTSINDSACYSYMGATVTQVTSGQGRVTMIAKSPTSDKSYLLLLGNSSTVISDEGIQTPSITQTSLQSQKKNFEKMPDTALEIINNIDIYKYNLKSEKDTDKKHIGFVIGEDYKYSQEITSIDNQGVDNYSFTSLCCKAIQEQQELIEKMQKEIKELKEAK